MPKSKIEQKCLNFDLEPESETPINKNPLDGVDTDNIDFSFEDRLVKRKHLENQEIYQDVRRLTRHLF